MLRTIAVFFYVFLYLTIGSWRFLWLKFFPEGRERDMKALNMVQGALRRIIFLSGVSVEVEGDENLPENESVLFVGNHRSYFDVVISYTLVKNLTGFIAKTELEKYGTLKTWMLKLYCLFIERDNLKQNLKVILEAIKQVKRGISIWIYPEGTRSKGRDPEEMLPFKDGSFKIAEKTGCKIIPVAMVPTRDILEAHFPLIKSTHVKVKIGKPIDLNMLSDEERGNIGGYVRDILAGYIHDLK